MNAYIVISTPPSASPHKEPSFIGRLAIVALRRIVPEGNPDFSDELYNRVVKWHVEIEDSTGEPLREIGLNTAGRVLAIAPWRENYGVIVDCNATFNPSEYEHISPEQFEQGVAQLPCSERRLTIRRCELLRASRWLLPAIPSPSPILATFARSQRAAFRSR